MIGHVEGGMQVMMDSLGLRQKGVRNFPRSPHSRHLLAFKYRDAKCSPSKCKATACTASSA